MNRHGYKVRKFGREKGQRTALIKGLANELILKESIETTLPKAKAAAKYTERLITKAKLAKDDLHRRRQVIRGLQTLEAAHKLVDDLSPKLEKRSSGFLSVKRTTERRGDGAQMARVKFVDELGSKAKSEPVKKAAVKSAEESEEDTDKQTGRSTDFRPEKAIKENVAKQAVQAPKRTGRRGNR